MKFYALYENLYEGVQLRLDQLKKASEDCGIEFCAVNSKTFDYTNIPRLSKNDLLYNTSIGTQTLESLLLNKEVTTFYIKNPSLNQTLTTTDWTIIHEKANLPAPKTIFHLTDNRELLEKYIEYLGGFPIVLKAAGSTRGIGTIKIDSWQNLISTADYLIKTGDKFILREFIKAKSGGRLMVLGDEVIASAEFAMHENDFRNAVDLSQTKYINRRYPKHIEEIAVQATHLANADFAGVDFLEDEAGNFYLLEINFPSGFSALIDVCGVDIPKRMVEYLIKKSKEQ